MNTTKCFACGGDRMAQTTREVRKRVAGRTFVAVEPVEVCGACGEITVDARAVHAFELAIAKALADAGPRSGEELKLMRKALELRADELAELLDVTRETVSRWENDKQPLERRAVALVSELVVDRIEGRTRTLDRLRALRAPPRLAKTVRVELPGSTDRER